MPNKGNHCTIKKNVISVSSGDIPSIRHELAKSLGAIMLRRYSDVKFNPMIVAALKAIEREIKDMGFVKSPASYITEACPNENKERRVDLVNIDTDTRYEFETSLKVKKVDDGHLVITIYI